MSARLGRAVGICAAKALRRQFPHPDFRTKTSLREHFKGLMFDCHRQQSGANDYAHLEASVGTSADAARMSAYATMISTFYRASPKAKRHWAPTPAICESERAFWQPARR